MSANGEGGENGENGEASQPDDAADDGGAEGDGGDEKADWKTKPYSELNPDELEKRRALRKKKKEHERQQYLDSRPDNPYENSPAEKADVVPPIDGKQPETVDWIAESRDDRDGDGGSSNDETGDGGGGDAGGTERDMAAGGGEDSEHAFAEGDVVEYDGEKAVVTTVMTEPFDAPTQRALASESSESGVGGGEGEGGGKGRNGSESDSNGDGDDPPEETIEASEDEPLFIVLPESGGWAAVSADEIMPSAFEDGEPDARELGKADLAPAYTRAGKRGIAVTDLVNIRGAKGPHIGFDELPEGWDRKSVLQAYASLGASFSTCRTQMAGEIRSPARFCAALKDTVYETTYWRSWE
jgi:hypothetical protein